jgi:competence CoiA-like predicted nuclease
LVAWHWAHRSREDCDTWAEPDSAWHRSWQSIVPPAQREVIIGKHRADIVNSKGHIVELQHSSISPGEIREREDYYGQMSWIFDATEAYADDRLEIFLKHDHVTFRWKHPRKSLVACRAPVFLDLGVDDEVLRVKELHFEGAPYRGWGKILRFDRTHKSVAA